MSFVIFFFQEAVRVGDWTVGSRLLGGHARPDGGFVRALRGVSLERVGLQRRPSVSLPEDATSQATGWGGFRAWKSQSWKGLQRGYHCVLFVTS